MGCIAWQYTELQIAQLHYNVRTIEISVYTILYLTYIVFCIQNVFFIREK